MIASPLQVAGLTDDMAQEPAETWGEGFRAMGKPVGAHVAPDGQRPPSERPTGIHSCVERTDLHVHF
jgi:hypothetical protein